MNKKTPDSKSLAEALDIIERAAKESSSDFMGDLKPEFERIKKIWQGIAPAVSDVKDNVLESGREAATNAMHAGREALTSVNKKAKEDPWLLAGLIGIFALALGFILGRSRND